MSASREVLSTVRDAFIPEKEQEMENFMESGFCGCALVNMVGEKQKDFWREGTEHYWRMGEAEILGGHLDIQWKMFGQFSSFGFM